jgi:hypothetical protein
MTKTVLNAIAVAGAVAFVSPSMAAMVNFTAEMNAASEVPPNSSKATGTVTATYDTGSKMLTWKGSYKDLTGPATAAHFHGPAPSGKNANVMVPINPHDTTFEGSATLNDAQAKALMDGDLYANVHTAANPGGEIRGQLKQ